MMQFQENAWTEGQTERRKDRKTESSYFTGPFRLLPGVQKGNLNVETKTKQSYKKLFLFMVKEW